MEEERYSVKIKHVDTGEERIAQFLEGYDTSARNYTLAVEIPDLLHKMFEAWSLFHCMVELRREIEAVD